MIQAKKQDTSTLQKKLIFWSANCHHQEIALYLSLGIAKFSKIATKLGHTEHKEMVWKCLNTASIDNYTYMANPPNPSFISFILYLWKHYPNENGDKDKNELKRESYFFISSLHFTKKSWAAPFYDFSKISILLLYMRRGWYYE